MPKDPEMVVTRTPLELDERAIRKLNRLLARTHDQALRIASENATRGAFPTELAILYFRRAAPASHDD
jgi:hypothetical protein